MKRPGMRPPKREGGQKAAERGRWGCEQRVSLFPWGGAVLEFVGEWGSALLPVTPLLGKLTLPTAAALTQKGLAAAFLRGGAGQRALAEGICPGLRLRPWQVGPLLVIPTPREAIMDPVLPLPKPESRTVATSAFRRKMGGGRSGDRMIDGC